MNKMEKHVDKRFYNIWSIAQLGERLNGIQEVMGSNPTISTFTISRRHESLWLKL